MQFLSEINIKISFDSIVFKAGIWNKNKNKQGRFPVLQQKNFKMKNELSSHL